MQWLRSLVFTAFLFAWSFLYAVFFVLVSWTMPVPRRYRLAAWYARRLLNALRLLCKLDYEVTGLENLPAEPHVVLWKHSSAWETFSQFLIGPPKVLVLKRELIFIPFFGWAMARLRPQSLLNNNPLQGLLHELVPMDRLPAVLGRKQLAAELAAPGATAYAPAAEQQIDGEEADVVSALGILGARVAEPYD